MNKKLLFNYNKTSIKTMSISIKNATTEEDMSITKPSFGVHETFNGQYVVTDFSLNGSPFKMVFTNMITFNRYTPTYGFSMSPDKESTDPKVFNKVLKIFNKLGLSFKQKKFYSSLAFRPMYSPDSKYPYDIQTSFGDEFDFKVGDGPLQTITSETKHTVIEMLSPSTEGQQKITNLHCEVIPGITTFTPKATGVKSYRFKMTIVKLHIIPYNGATSKQEPSDFTVNIDDSDESEQDEQSEQEQDEHSEQEQDM